MFLWFTKTHAISFLIAAVLSSLKVFTDVPLWFKYKIFLLLELLFKKDAVHDKDLLTFNT